VHTVQNEDEVVRAAGGEYVRVYAADYEPFTDAQVDKLVGFRQTRPVGSWVHVHCAAGQGRTTQVLVLFDMVENAGTTGLQDIVDRQKDAGGINVLSTKSTPAWRHAGEVARARLMRRFYDYAKEHARGEGETWSSWSARNP